MAVAAARTAAASAILTCRAVGYAAVTLVAVATCMTTRSSTVLVCTAALVGTAVTLATAVVECGVASPATVVHVD